MKRAQAALAEANDAVGDVADPSLINSDSEKRVKARVKRKARADFVEDSKVEGKNIGSGNGDEFKQKMVWMATVIADDQKKDCENFFLNGFSVRVRFLGTITTLPDLDEPDSGGRKDAVLAIHKEDVAKFAIARFKMGNDHPMWWQDYVDNNKSIIPPGEKALFESL
jgi:hypothetical protein